VLSPLARFAAPCAALVLSACAGGGASVRREIASLRAEFATLRGQNEALARRVDLLSARLERAGEQARAPAQPPPPAAPPAEAAPLVPPDLAVVRVAPPRPPDEEPSAPPIVLTDAPRKGRVAPRLSTAVPISEPDADRLDELAQPQGRGIAAEAETELAAARRKDGAERAHALESFVARYPRHPSADNALVEAARQYAEEGRHGAACDLARRVPEDYPAGDAVSGALEIVARCERSRP